MEWLNFLNLPKENLLTMEEFFIVLVFYAGIQKNMEKRNIQSFMLC